ncbi:MAG: TonB-dependent receptor, partial [Kiritimatiellae bacterium]|nr:TonB-dependent receptor [Kiritimatiellia bacterium]
DEVLARYDEASSVFSVFGEDEMFFSDSVRLTVGLRGEYEPAYGIALGSRAGLLLRPRGDTRIFAAVARTCRTPALSDRYIKVVYNNFVFEGNPDLEPEYLTSYEVGVRTRPTERVEFDVSLFYNDLDDAFDFMLDPDGIFRVRNVNRMNTYGLEGEVRVGLGAGISALVNYSRTEGRYLDFPANPEVEGNRIENLARDKAATGLLFSGKRASHSLTARFVGDRFGDTRNSEENRMGDYVVFDWRSRIRLREPVRLTLRVDNLFNRSYREFPGTEQPGIWALVGMEVDM